MLCLIKNYWFIILVFNFINNFERQTMPGYAAWSKRWWRTRAPLPGKVRCLSMCSKKLLFIKKPPSAIAVTFQRGTGTRPHNPALHTRARGGFISVDSRQQFYNHIYEPILRRYYLGANSLSWDCFPLIFQLNNRNNYSLAFCQFFSNKPHLRAIL